MSVWHENSTPGAGMGAGTPALLMFQALGGGRHKLQCPTQFLCSTLRLLLEVYARGRVEHGLWEMCRQYVQLSSCVPTRQGTVRVVFRWTMAYVHFVSLALALAQIEPTVVYVVLGSFKAQPGVRVFTCQLPFQHNQDICW